METDSLSKKITVTLITAQLSDSGRYSCRIKEPQENSYSYRNISLTVKGNKISTMQHLS